VSLAAGKLLWKFRVFLPGIALADNKDKRRGIFSDILQGSAF
jgi:hypothetical protein